MDMKTSVLVQSKSRVYTHFQKKKKKKIQLNYLPPPPESTIFAYDQLTIFLHLVPPTYICPKCTYKSQK